MEAETMHRGRFRKHVWAHLIVVNASEESARSEASADREGSEGGHYTVKLRSGLLALLHKKPQKLLGFQA